METEAVQFAQEEARRGGGAEMESLSTATYREDAFTSPKEEEYPDDYFPSSTADFPSPTAKAIVEVVDTSLRHTNSAAFFSSSFCWVSGCLCAVLLRAIS